jgi:diamine N-acetyltransferase
MKTKYSAIGGSMIELRKITEDSFNECIGLQIKEEQKGFVAANIKSLAQAWIAFDNHQCIPIAFAIYHDDTMVGFVMIAYFKYDANKPDESEIYTVWRFMIDKAYQGKGFGKSAMAKVLDYIKAYPCGQATKVVLSYEPENTVAKALYASFGFKETGEICDGEIVAKLALF